MSEKNSMYIFKYIQCFIYIKKYFSVKKKKKEILPSVMAWKNLVGITQGEISQMKRDKHCALLFMKGERVSCSVMSSAL